MRTYCIILDDNIPREDASSQSDKRKYPIIHARSEKV